jgi:hypothetical protein
MGVFWDIKPLRDWPSYYLGAKVILYILRICRFKESTLQVMGASSPDKENEWAIVGGTGEFAMARGTIKRRVSSVTGGTSTQELTIEFFCRMKVSIINFRSSNLHYIYVVRHLLLFSVISNRAHCSGCIICWGTTIILRA